MVAFNALAVESLEDWTTAPGGVAGSANRFATGRRRAADDARLVAWLIDLLVADDLAEAGIVVAEDGYVWPIEETARRLADDLEAEREPTAQTQLFERLAEFKAAFERAASWLAN